MSTQPAIAPGVVKLRLLGQPEDIDALAAVLGASPAVEVIDRSGPRTNRYDEGVRVTPFEERGSADIYNIASANVYVEFVAGEGWLEPGGDVTFTWMNETHG